ncbi:flagellar basal-body MS-ring/collar protein FliF [Opitutus sp. ER46]|uniref:flagellar basal-body MS-ring/collar protein FliF n=1 Tax=Opitutus sp. ER46 TaxID=2161864 RepID=UPI000D30CA74|nr:flagellar basal-body MS-ring/collar protein FliF [Opitutus sp. ER46]PTX90896.1 flagellar M-ring protein FliF [Opitutus sp. ER46]
MKNFAQSLLELWKHLGVNQRVSLIVAAVAVIGGLIGVTLWSQRPDYQLLYARMGDKDAAAVISYLQSQNIPHKVTAGGSAVQVPSSAVYKLRMELAGKGLPSGEGVGFEIFDKGQFGLSDFVQRTNYLRAVQGELGRTIMQLQGVRSARVMIVQPENRLLLTEQGVKSTASVFVDVGGGKLEIDQVNAIRHLVANAVQGLAPDQVAVIDNRGRTLSEELKQDPTLGTASSQIRYREQVEAYFAKKVESMLSAVIGPGNAVVRVSADIDTEATTMNSERWNPDGQVVRSQTQTDDTTNTTETRSGGGAAGVSANVPEKQAGATETARPISQSEQTRKNKTITYEIDRTTTSTTRNPGTVRSLTASVIISRRPPTLVPPADPTAKDARPTSQPAAPRTAQELDQLRQVVINALGLKPQPGQTLDSLVTLQEQEFTAVDPLAALPPVPLEARVGGWFEVASRWAAVVGAGVVLLVFWRMFKRQKPEAVPIEVLSMSPEQTTRTLPNASNVTPELLNELIRQKPANIGVALREWVSAGSPGGAPASKN